jgi:hypothetical protein
MPIGVRVELPFPKPALPLASTGPVDQFPTRPSSLLPPCRYGAVKPSMVRRSRTSARRAIAMISIWSQE